MANLRRLIKTTAIRLGLRYALLYALLITAGLALLYASTSKFVDVQVEVGLERELQSLVQIDIHQGRANLIRSIQAKSQLLDDGQQYYLLVSTQDQHLAGNLLIWPENVKTDGKVHNIWIKDFPVPGGMEDDAGFWPVISSTLQDGTKLLVAHRIDQTEDLLEFILSVMMLILLLSVILAMTMGILLGRNILKRIDSINITARAITLGNLDQRVPVSQQNDEFDELAHHLNNMLTRIEQLVMGMRRVSDNIAHDLRRPLSRLHNRLDVTLLETRTPDEYIHAIRQSIDDADELLKTFNALLEIAQTEAGSFRGEWYQVVLSELCQNLGELYKDVAEELGMRFDLDVTPGIRLQGNRHLLSQAIRNLLENAIQYSQQGKYVELKLAQFNGQIQLSVADHGSGIPKDQHDTVLERFTRLESARNSPGSGLGLSLVKAVADLHHAHIKLEDNQPGLRITISFSEA